MREERKEERLEARRPPNYMPGPLSTCHIFTLQLCIGTLHLLVYFYIDPKHSFSNSLLQSSYSLFSFLDGLRSSVGGLDSLACWLCLAPT